MTTVKDLSTEHAFVSNLFKWPQKRSDWEAYKLTQEQLQFFEEYGYLSNVKLLDEPQIAVLKRELEQIMDPDYEGNPLFYEFHTNESADPDAVLFHALGAWRITPAFHDVLWNPAFVMAASQLLGNRAVRFWHDQLFCKPAHHGGVVAWHQDYSYWTRTGPIQHLTCWVGLDNATKANGCLYYVPKSHKWGLLDKPELAGDMEGVLDYLTEDQKQEFKPVPIELKAGYAAFHHPLLVHGSYENKSDQARRAFVLNVFADGTASNSDDEILKGVPPIRSGEKMQGRFFPLLFEPAGL
jgi:ectoine hydroxylase-related dioxygenase (phytanoyl-CoA dioxygenase family)